MAPRNNFARLTRDCRRRIMYLMVNGATQEEVRLDPEVAPELERKALALHSTTFQAIERGKEYADYQRSLETTERQVSADRWAAEALRDCAGITSIADVTQLELLKQLREFAVKGSGEPGDLLKLATAVTRIKAADSDDRIARLNRQLDEVKRAAAETESGLRRKVEEMIAENETLKQKLAKYGSENSGAVIEEMDRFVGR